MKKIAFLVIVVSMLLIAGCTTQSPQPSKSQSPGTIALPSPTFRLADNSLPMDGHMVHRTSNTTFDVSIDSIETGELQENGERDLTIYIAAKNTGYNPVRLVWFSKLTDMYGKTYGGIGISHAGNGARSGWIQSNLTEIARDYVTIRSDKDLATLSNGAVLDVYFMEKPSNNVSVSMIPDYHTRWTIEPGKIR